MSSSLYPHLNIRGHGEPLPYTTIMSPTEFYVNRAQQPIPSHHQDESEQAPRKRMPASNRSYARLKATNASSWLICFQWDENISHQLFWRRRAWIVAIDFKSRRETQFSPTVR